MNQPQKPRKHHFVPQCYLRLFLNDDHLFILDIAKVKGNVKKEIKTATPGQICYLPDYYTLIPSAVSNTFRLHEHHDMFIEQDVFLTLENKYAKIVSLLIEKNELSVKELILLSDFIIQLKLRNPYWKEKVVEGKKSEWLNAAMDDITARARKDTRFSKIPDEVKEKLLDNLRKANIENPHFAKEAQHFSLIQRFSPDNPNNTQVRETLLNCGWQLFKAPDKGPFFITSDNPGVGCGKEGTTHNTKFKDGFFFFLPLTPQFCLVITDEDMDNTLLNKKLSKKISCVPVNKEVVLLINDRTIQVANNLLIASDTWYLSQIAAINKPQS